MIYFWLTLNWFWTNPLYNALIPSSLAILTKAWSIPRYLISFCLASITWPWSCSRVFVVSIGNVPVTKHHSKIFNIYVPNHIAGLTTTMGNRSKKLKQVVWSNSFKCPYSCILNNHCCTFYGHEQASKCVYSVTPNIPPVILLTVFHTILMM